MAIKLVTSKAYVDNLRNFLPEKPNSKTPAGEKANKIFDQITNSPNFIFNKSDKRITDSITTLLTIHPGRTLFKRLLKANKLLKIVFDLKTLPTYRYSANTVILNASTVRRYISVNPDGEKFYISAPDSITLAHELIHALHHFEEGEVFIADKQKNNNILDPHLDNLEEEETIIGKEGKGTLCENVFLFHFGYPLRINHNGLELEKGKTFTASECAADGALANLKEMLLSNPSLLNLPQRCANTAYRGKITPLNASIRARQMEISDYLFQAGVDVNAMDDYGTALRAAIVTRHPDLVKVLLEKGAALDVKDRKGFTALELALAVKNDEAAELLAPLSNLKETNEQLLSILHRTIKGGSPEGFRALIRHGADINCKDLEGNTLLMHFCNFEYTIDNAKIFKQKFKILLENNLSDLNAKNINGESALFMAVQKGHFWQVDALVKKGAEIPPYLEAEVEQYIKWYADGDHDDPSGFLRCEFAWGNTFSDNTDDKEIAIESYITI